MDVIITMTRSKIIDHAKKQGEKELSGGWVWLNYKKHTSCQERSLVAMKGLKTVSAVFYLL